jgi:Na+(H+)/acetate symporter ActP
MLLSGLASTFDSGLCAGASLWAIDTVKLSNEERECLYKERLNIELTDKERIIKEDLDRKTPIRSRYAMVGLTLLGLLVAFMVEYIPGFGLDKLWWVFNAIASMAVVPTILSLYWNRQSTKGVLLGFAGSFIGIVFFVIGNAINNNDMVVFSAIFIIIISLIMNLIFPSKVAFKDIQ